MPTIYNNIENQFLQGLSYSLQDATRTGEASKKDAFSLPLSRGGRGVSFLKEDGDE